MEIFYYVGVATVSLFIAVGFAHAALFCVKLYTKTFSDADNVIKYYAAWKREQIVRDENAVGRCEICGKLVYHSEEWFGDFEGVFWHKACWNKEED